MSRKSLHKLRYLTLAVRAACYSLLLMNAARVQADQTGGIIRDGTGNINQNGLTTTINQTSQNMAIDWQTFNVNVDERVQYIQPNSSSISLNRILSNTGSTIAGRIDANGQVILVNPHGVFFTPTAQINVGGMIASGLDINVTDFMNSNYIFNEVLGTEGAVINSGTINAALGGNVALLGRHVENTGLISATLGTVNLAAGKQAVLTFDNTGLLGVRVSKEILQNELGVDAAVLNSGDITAAGGRVLMTGSVSQDVFSQAVNSAEQARSVVVNTDGTFTLGADVVNSGSVDVSSADSAAGNIVLLGENITSSGELHADAINANAGEIELHANDTTLLTQNSLTTARAENNGDGGVVKILGDKVGLIDQSTVDVSGTNGGGRAYIGGDYQGKNDLMRNASFTTVAPDASIYADASNEGDAGSIIVWANDYTRYFGDIFARGGVLGGDGGFAEVSGKESLDFVGDVDLSAVLGHGGMLLLDPKNITICSSCASTYTTFDSYALFTANPAATPTYLSNTDLATRLTGFNVTLSANNDITFAANTNVTSAQGGGALIGNLTLQAGRSIILNDNVHITLNNANFTATINDGNDGSNNAPTTRDPGPAVFTMNTGSWIVTNGGDITINTGTFTGLDIGNFTLLLLDASSNSPSITGGAINLTNSTGNITANGVIDSSGGTSTTDEISGSNAGTISLSARDVNINGSISAIGGDGPNNGNDDGNGGLGGSISISATQNVFIDATISTNGGRAARGNGTADGNGGNAGTVDVDAGNNLEVNAIISANGGSGPTRNGNGGNAEAVTLTANNIFTANANINAQGGSAGGNSGSDGNAASIVINGNGSDNTFNINNNILLTGSTVTLNGLGGHDRLVRGGTSTINTWTVFDFGAGADGVNDGTVVFGANTLRFVNIENLVGNSGVDTFTIGAVGSLSGLMDGGAGANDELTINPTGITVQLGDRTALDAFNDGSLNVNNIEILTADSGSTSSNVIRGDNIAATWTIDGPNTGTVAPTVGATTGNTTRFNNFATLTGGSLVDLFTISASFAGALNSGASADIITIASTGSVSGLIDGGTGTGIETDQLIINANGDRTVQISSTDTTADLTVNNIENINASGTINNTPLGNTLTAANAINTWTLDGTPSVGSVDFTGFTVLIGGTNVDTFNITQNFTGTINGGNNNDFFNIDAANLTLASLIGGDGSDTFNINAAGATITLAGGTDTGSDTLRGLTAGGNWQINDTNAGTLDTTITFSQIENLTGGAGVDTFTFTSAGTTGSLSGLMNGGTGSDRLNIVALGAQTVNVYDAMPAQPTNTAGNLSLYQIEAVTGNPAVSNTLRGPNVTSTWYVEPTPDPVTTSPSDGINDGRLVFGPTLTPVTVSFFDFNHLVGNSAGDEFRMDAAGSITGTSAQIDGGSGSPNTLLARSGVNNIWAFTSTTAGSLSQVSTPSNISYVQTFTNIQNFVGGGGVEWADFSANVAAIVGINVNSYTGFTGVIGNGGNSTLTGINGQTNNWEIYDLADLPAAASAGAGVRDGNNDGIVNRGQAGELLFIDFANLTGGDQNDTFALTGNLTGLLSGGGGTSNTLTISNTLINRVEIGVAGNAANLNVTGLNTITGNGTTILLGDSSLATNNWLLNGANSGTLNALTPNALTFNTFAALEGGSTNDNFTLDALTDFGGSINGGTGTGSDQILASNRAINTWIITGNNNTGTVSGLVGGFSNIEILLGNAQQDIFTLHDSIDFSGTINGNGGNIDELRAGNRASNTWAITAANNTGTVSGLVGGFSNVDILTGNAQQDIFTLHDSINFTGTINGNGGVSDELRAGNRATNTWAITAANNTGTVSGLSGTFTAIETLTGNAQRDLFNLHDTLDFTGSLNGAGGTNDEVVAGNRLTNTWSITGANNTGVVTGITGTFSNVEQLTGNSGADNFNLHATADFAGNINGGGGTNSLTGGARATGWTINTSNGGSVTGLGAGNTFSAIQNLNGSAAVVDDTFTFQDGGSLAGQIEGGAQAIADVVDMSQVTTDISVQLGTGQPITGIERVIGNNDGVGSDPNSALVGGYSDNTWIINNANDGSINGVSFVNFNNLTGNTGSDTFTFTAAGSLSGLINGDSPNITAWTPGASWTPWTTGQPADRVYMNALTTVDVTLGQDIANIELLIGSDTGNGILRFAPGTNNANITGSNTGIVNGTEFRQFNELVGNTGADTFEVSGGGNIATLRGGAGGDIFVVQLNGTVSSIYGEADNDAFDILGAVTLIDGGSGSDSIISRDPNLVLTVGDNLSGFEGVTAFNGGTLNARNATTTTWDITATGAGNVADIGFTSSTGDDESLTFSGFTTLNGGDGTDIFTVTNNGSVTGLISGNAGADTLTINLTNRTTLGSGQINFDGGGDTGDTVTLSGPANVYTEAYNPNQTIGSLGAFDQLRFTTSAITFDANFREVANVTDNVQVSLLTLNSIDPANVTLGTNSFGISNAVSVDVDYAAASKNDIDVLAQNGGAVQITGNVTLAGSLSITADSITEITGSSITADTLLLRNTGTVGAANDGLNTNINNLHVTNAGAVYINEQNALVLAELNTTGLLDIATGGDITSSAILISSGAMNLATPGNITLSGDNQLDGVLSLTAATGDVTLRNNAATQIADITTQTLDINSTGTLTSSGPLIVTGTTTLASAADIFLDAANDFNAVSITAANNVRLNDIDDLTLSTITVTGDIATTSTGLALNTVNAGSVNFDAGTGAIVDLNGGATNITASSSILRAENGIGSITDAIETQTADLDVINTQGGYLNIHNTGTVTLTNLVNVGNITYVNTQGHVTLDHVETDYNTGTLDMRVTNGSIYGILPRTNAAGETVNFLSVNDIKASSAIITTTQELGTFTRPIVMDINDSLTYIAVGGFRPVVYGNPSIVDSSDLQGNAIGSVGAISGQQLIELESLADVDPAIFTAVRTYNYDDISIRMPSDQLFEDEAEDEEEDENATNNR